ncbi:MAG TPA: hypothetical protein VNO35_09925, partial [Steroidobacteraceae bacterium]|nr:hypothetical protein [Steroidobacteraceae bacterium]
EKDRFEQRGLARPVATPDQITLWVECQFGALETSQILHRQLNETHDAPEPSVSAASFTNGTACQRRLDQQGVFGQLPMGAARAAHG